MKIIIVGCGKIGSTLAEQLSYEQHDLVVIDTNPKKYSSFLKVLTLWELPEMVPVSTCFPKPASRMPIF